MDPWGLTTPILVFFVSFLVFLSLWKKDYKGRNLPPGPVPLPIIGNILQIDQKNFFMSLNKLYEKYGPVYTIYLGSQPVVVLHGYKALKEALIDQGDIFGGRGKIPVFENTFKGNGQPFNPHVILQYAPFNVISSILFHQRFNYDNEEFLSMMHILNENAILLNSPMIQLYNYFPWLFHYFMSHHKKFFSNTEATKKIFLDQVKKHQDTLDLNNPQNLVDCYFHKMQQEQKNPDSVFDMENLAAIGVDLFGAGTTTTSTTLAFSLFLILKHPEVQDKIHEEIDQVIGPHRIPSIKDKLEMPYTDAVLHEIQRYINIAPISMPHEVTHDTQFRQYFIPKGTMVFPFLSSVLFDPIEFPNPYQFDPGHFLHQDGRFKNSDYFMPFSIGKRACLGEGLAKMELFLLLVTILQNFTIKSVIDPKEIIIKPMSTRGVSCPPKYQLCFFPR